MSFPLWFFLIPYALVVVVTSVYVFFNLYHLNTYGVAKHGTSGVIGAYVVSYFVMLLVGLVVILSYDWTDRISPADLFDWSQIQSDTL